MSSQWAQSTGQLFHVTQGDAAEPEVYSSILWGVLFCFFSPSHCTSLKPHIPINKSRRVTRRNEIQQKHLGGDTNDTASGTTTGVASLEGFLVSTLTQVIGAGMDNNSPSQDAVRTNQLDDAINQRSPGNSMVVGLDVSQVTRMPVSVGGGAVSVSKGVEVRTSRGTSVGVVAELVDVHATGSVDVRVLDLVLDGGGSVLAILGEPDDARDAGITADDSNSSGHFN